MRECSKRRNHDDVDVSAAERRRRQKDRSSPDYWQKRVDAEECTAAFLTAIATLIEDASEITLALYVIIGHGEQESIIGQFSLLIYYSDSQDILHTLLSNAHRPYNDLCHVFVDHCSCMKIMGKTVSKW